MNKFNDIGFLSDELVGWIAQTRNEFLPSFEIAERCNRLGMRILFDIPTEKINHSQAFACAAAGRMMQSFQSSLLLTQRGALAEARAIVRNCSESVIAIGALRANPTTLDRLLEDRAFYRRSLANSVLEGVDGAKPNDEHVARLRAVLCEIEEDYGDKKLRRINWAELATGANLKGLYDMVYRLTSANAAHFTLDAAQRHIVPDENNIVGGFRFYPDKSDLGSTLFGANACILHGLDIIVDWFEMKAFAEELRLCTELWKEKSQTED